MVRSETMSENIIELKNIKKVFDDTVVVEDFNLTVKKGASSLPFSVRPAAARRPRCE